MKLSYFAALLIAAALLAGCFGSEENGKPVTKEEFEKALAASERVTVIMDTRGSPSAAKDRVLQCGVDLAGSRGLVGKNLSIYAFEADKCFGSKNTSTGVGDCLSQAKGSTILQVKYGAENASFYENKLLIMVNENTTSSCTITVRQN